MASISEWVNAARVRTLPVGLSGVIIGNTCAAIVQPLNWTIVICSFITTFLLQILSNYANDLGDFINGADTIVNRKDRALSSNSITKREMLNAILIVSIVAFISGILLLYFSFQSFYNMYVLLFFILGIGAILAAIFYTFGKKPYGYYGLGDISVFVFFGLIAVLGNYFLQIQTLNITIVLPAICMGLWAVATLNINNMRDIETDKLARKITIPVRLGIKKAFVYHVFLILFSWLCLIIYTYQIKNNAIQFSYVLMFFSFIIHLIQLYKSLNKGHEKMTDMLKKLSLLVLFTSLIFCIATIRFN